MELRKIALQKNSPWESKIRALYEHAFPKEERVAWWILRLNACRKGFDLAAWVDGDAFCGFTLSTTVDGLHFLMFLAVEPEKQGLGYGSAILTAVRQEHERIVLNMEPLDEDAPNMQQRRRRFCFYRKNGFHDTGWDVWEVGGRFRILSTQSQLIAADYKKLFRWLSFGLWNVKLRNTENRGESQ